MDQLVVEQQQPYEKKNDFLDTLGNLSQLIRRKIQIINFSSSNFFLGQIEFNESFIINFLQKKKKKIFHKILGQFHFISVYYVPTEKVF